MYKVILQSQNGQWKACWRRTLFIIFFSTTSFWEGKQNVYWYFRHINFVNEINARCVGDKLESLEVVFSPKNQFEKYHWALKLAGLSLKLCKPLSKSSISLICSQHKLCNSFSTICVFSTSYQRSSAVSKNIKSRYTCTVCYWPSLRSWYTCMCYWPSMRSR